MPISSLKTKKSPSPYNNEMSAVVVFADGTTLYGYGIGTAGNALGEVCFNTSMTGYQEILTDPSYAGQIINFTFPHIGNVGTNAEDIEAQKPHARGLIIREDMTGPSNWRATAHLDEWLKQHEMVGICGLDTRALTRHIRDSGAPNAVICHAKDGKFDLDALKEQAANWSGLEGLDLAKDVTCDKPYEWTEASWDLKDGYGTQDTPKYHVVAVDFGAKYNILRYLTSAGCRVTVVPATTSADDILALKPDGVFLSNGPGDPAATGEYAVPTIQALLDKNIPLFGICLGHQMLALALGGKTEKMHLGHRGANHPVKDLQTGTVEITSQNHGFQVIPDSLPKDVEITHTSLFDDSNEGIKHKTKPVFSVQYHPEASPGPQDSHYLFDRFVEMIEENHA
ncbi:MAG: glutamine-hydrolyzing carbamoyl-phosphate synthase small subunit [Alphaproteobacteria bacterium]|nr:glutamine-hydrolyzing carbamoyl-phosphate synthase small subunit [Alphaproteobacteria bacterium]